MYNVLPFCLIVKVQFVFLSLKVKVECAPISSYCNGKIHSNFIYSRSRNIFTFFIGPGWLNELGSWIT